MKETAEITELDVKQYYELTLKAKKLDEELKRYKELFHSYFDQTIGPDEKGELSIGEYKLQRQIRQTESYHEEKTIKRLEELDLNDCIITVKKPDKQKIDAAMTLGLISGSQLKDCILKKLSKAIVVREEKS